MDHGGILSVCMMWIEHLHHSRKDVPFPGKMSPFQERCPLASQISFTAWHIAVRFGREAPISSLFGWERSDHTRQRFSAAGPAYARLRGLAPAVTASQMYAG